jgi:hypothetical protein
MHIFVPLFVPCGLVVQAIPSQYIVNLIIKFYGDAGSFKSERANRLLNPNPKSWHSVGWDHWLVYLPYLGMVNKLANEPGLHVVP